MRLQYVLFLHFLVIYVSLLGTVADLKSDKEALLDFIAAVPHSRKLNWTSASSVCRSWVGITCTENKNGGVLSLRLPGVGLYGPIPANTLGRMDSLTILSLRSNGLTGSLPDDILSLPSLRYIYLQKNNFSGDIPSSFSNKLEIIDLSFNSFTGSIPIAVENLTNLTGLSLQNNFLTGSIPLLKPPKLEYLNLSNNQLSGSVPTSLQEFPASSFQGNSRLCGSPLNQCLYLTPSPSPSPNFLPPIPPTAYLPTSPTAATPIPKSKGSLSTGSVIAIAFGASSVSFLLFLAIVLYCLKKPNVREGRNILRGKSFIVGRVEKPKEDFGSGLQEAKNNKLVFFDGGSHNFDLEDLLRASAEVLGKGSYGTTYKATLEDGTILAVKRLRDIGVGEKEFEQQMETIGSVRQHQHIVSLRAYYYSKDEKLLVYEYIPIASLSTLLHGNRESGITLDWVSRVKVALGSAKGFAHIHSAAAGKLVHGNIRSSNILLTRDLHGRISDLGLSPLFESAIIPLRSVGYRAPELIVTQKATQKSDVYSFGVLLLEILTGRSPVQSPGHGDVVDLPRWVKSIVRDEWTSEVFDAELIKYHDIEEEMVQMLQIAMACVAMQPEMRPAMQEVVNMIEKIRTQDTQSRHSSEDNYLKSLTTTP
ncbi:putative inactive receptor kinase [Heracleum sosnowskyi]|uniref:Inactive receptor kinase n=1 Tax=Heracleum sosnowskyi TaxID=360622 RepID=A0AAD8GNV3_9APIA|nr:putative inactive receptor kinase [Heracleum sosnowskyi]